MMTNLIHNIENEDNPELRVIVIEAEGKVFSAGHNLKELVKISSFLLKLILLHIQFAVKRKRCKNPQKSFQFSFQSHEFHNRLSGPCYS